ncbi:hypothetical protein HYE67_010352 [Fusarium culmorum]|uniref:Uncharacterized protein n=1 Tax=Fusarium culmorum TaxID=5516 RepID=A0A2T4H4M6_FUSCU|nr:hypothetical protein FCULG_00011379 [Fusarium culmorum]QPC68121.1 hypothetical protein HYE67_010352 [Fusarium culmorum]
MNARPLMTEKTADMIDVWVSFRCPRLVPECSTTYIDWDKYNESLKLHTESKDMPRMGDESSISCKDLGKPTLLGLVHDVPSSHTNCWSPRCPMNNVEIAKIELRMQLATHRRASSRPFLRVMAVEKRVRRCMLWKPTKSPMVRFSVGDGEDDTDRGQAQAMTTSADCFIFS